MANTVRWSGKWTFQYRGVTRTHWEAIQRRSKEITGAEFVGNCGETRGDFVVSYRYVPRTGMLLFRVIRDSEYRNRFWLELFFMRLLSGHWPAEIDQEAFRAVHGTGKLG